MVSHRNISIYTSEIYNSFLFKSVFQCIKFLHFMIIINNLRILKQYKIGKILSMFTTHEKYGLMLCIVQGVIIDRK